MDAGQFDRNIAMSASAPETSTQRVFAYLEALRTHCGGRDEAAAAIRGRLAEDPVLGEHIKTLDDYLQALAEARRGRGSAPATRRQLDDLWRRANTADAYRRVVEWHAGAEAQNAGLDRDWLQTAFPVGHVSSRRWQATIDPIGTTALRPLPGDGGGGGGGGGDPDPAPAPAPHAPPPLRICTVAPYEVAFPDSAITGVAVASAYPGASVENGHLYLISTTVAPVLAGGGTDSRALIGGTVKWPDGYATLALTATVRLDYASLFAVAVLGGATASAEVLMTVTLADGSQRAAATPLGAAVAPLLWHTDLSVPGTYTVVMAGIPLNGQAGEAQVVAGVHDNTAAVGVVGSSGASTSISGQLLSICMDVA